MLTIPQVSQKITPDSQKSTLDKAGENLSGGADRVASTFQGEGNKSATQSASDSLRGGSDSASGEVCLYSFTSITHTLLTLFLQAKSWSQSATDTANSAVEGVKNALGTNQK